LQAGGRRFDPVWLHQAALHRSCKSKRAKSKNSFARILNPPRPALSGAGVMSDIVKRRSIRVFGVTVKVATTRYLHAADAARAAPDANVGEA
jgi:hypothetical protein